MDYRRLSVDGWIDGECCLGVYDSEVSGVSIRAADLEDFDSYYGVIDMKRKCKCGRKDCPVCSNNFKKK
jgi:hypothetical protein